MSRYSTLRLNSRYHRHHYARVPREADNVLKKQIRIALVGAPSCGKTSLLNRFDKNKFEPNIKKTIGANTVTKQDVKYSEDPPIQVDITDISHHSDGVSHYLRLPSQLVYFCYDLSSKDSFNWLKTFAQNAEVQNIIANKKIILVGCKKDLATENNITRDEIELFKQEIDCSEEYECSAKIDTLDEINKIFETSIQNYFQDKFEEQLQEGATANCCTIV